MEIFGTGSIPYYKSDFKNGIITIKGISIDDDVKDFFTSVLNDLKVNLSECKKNIKLEIDLVYFNTRTSRYLMDIFNLCRDITTLNGYSVSVDWYYEEDDLDMQETGIDYQNITKIPFKTISREPSNMDDYDIDL